jgi:hypothetical protein
MAAYYKVDVSLNTNAVEVGLPSPQTVNVTIPLVGPAGPQGPAGEGGGGDGVETYTVTGSTFTVPDVRAARVFIDTSVASNITITLNAASPQNLDRVEIILVKIQSGFKATVVTGGFGDFDIFGTQKATFVYGANIGPARWVKAFDNVFQEAVPTQYNSIGQPGSIAFADNFLYICVGNGDWRRVAVSEWTTP